MNTETLSIEQKYAFEKYKCGNNLFITGPGGSGKTKLIENFIEYANINKKKIQVCALTGCAAVLLNCNAKTIHSWSGIRLARGEQDKIIASVLKNRYAMKEWKRINILVIDEVSMMSLKVFELLNTIGKIMRKNPYPFGGIQVIFTGDFFQLPPVGTLGEPDTDKFCFESSHWNEVFKVENHIELKKIFRQNDMTYINILLEIRYGRINEENMEILRKCVNRPVDISNNNGCIPTKLFPLRSKVDYLNSVMFDKLDADEYHFDVCKKMDCKTYIETNKPFSLEDQTKCAKITKLEREYELDYLMNNSPCPKVLTLKKGASVLCTINLDIENSICNGSQGIIIDIIERRGSYTPVVKFSNGITKHISPHFWQSEEYPCIAIGQYPLSLAWALTIHKIQGATLSMAEIDIGKSIFECGQTYVALSRIKSLDGLYLSSFNPEKIRANPKVIEFYEMFKDMKPDLQDGCLDLTKYELKDEEYKDDIKIIKLK